MTNRFQFGFAQKMGQTPDELRSCLDGPLSGGGQSHFLCKAFPIALVAAICLTSLDQAIAADEIRTMIVRVSSVQLNGREYDECPAEFEITRADADRRIDLSSLEIRNWDISTQQSVGETLPFRWYDAALPDDFQVAEDNVSGTDGKTFQWSTRRRWAEFFPVIGEGRGGKIAWLHRQRNSQPQYYRISYRLLPAGQSPFQSAARGFIGDGCPRCEPLGASTTGMLHSRLAVADWNQDGLADLVIGGATGNIVWYPNHGTATKPSWPSAYLLVQADGRPLDTGWQAAPLVIDWDRDGRIDILVGAERNRILFYRNVGDPQTPKLVNQGFVELDGKPLQLPIKPVPNAPEGVFTLDYYPVLEVADWDGNGQRDLLAGGYITGRIFRYEEKGRSKDGIPILIDHGPLMADGQPLNVLDWAAAPTVADFDNDGDLDLISGNMAVSKSGSDEVRRETFLVYFENVGSRHDPVLTRKELPHRGDFPRAILGSPRAIDFNGDGLIDLAVSANTNLYLFPNIGTKSQPLFDVSASAMPSTWGSAPLPTWGLQFLDFNGDGKRDFLSMTSMYLQTEPGKFQRTELFASGCVIDHPPPHGDPWIFTQLADLNGDGRLDLLYGTHEGHVWLHVATDRTGWFDQTGVKLLLSDGKPLHVGPVPGQDVKDFTVLQGSRTTFTSADFDQDGRIDLIVGDTDGVARHFRNVGTPTNPVFEMVHQFETLGIRMVPFAADWNRDGRTDVVGSAANGKVVAWLNQGEGRFGKGEPIPFPPVPYGPSVSVVDWNEDGDDDLIIGTDYGYFCWFERSYLQRGLARAELVK